MTSVAIVGAGTLGRGIAALLARHEMTVSLVDTDPARIDAALAHLERRGRGARRLGERSLRRVGVKSSIAGAVADSDFVLECATESLEVKRSIVEEVDEACTPGTILATATSSIELEQIAAVSRRPEWLLACHWFNPPEVIRGVEVARGARTSDDTVERTLRFLAAVGRVGIEVASVPGFVANRLQEAMFAEALRLVGRGLVTPEAVDRVVRSTFGPRLSVCGPFELIDQIGLDTERRALLQLGASAGDGAYAETELLDDLLREDRRGLSSGAGFYRYHDPASESLAREEAFAAVQAVASSARADIDAQRATGAERHELG